MVNRPKSEAGLPTLQIGDRYITAFDPIMALNIIEQIAEGKLLKDLLDIPGAPSRSTWYRWMVLYPDLKEGYNIAREVSSEGMEERLLEICDELIKGETIPPAKLDQIKTAMAQLRWSAAKRNPKAYGERATETTVVPVQINTSLALEPGQAAPATSSIYTITAVRHTDEDGELEEVEEAFAPADPQVRRGKHKSPAQTRATIKARERAKSRKKNGTV